MGERNTMVESNGWQEYKIYVKEKLDEHSEMLRVICEKLESIHSDNQMLKFKSGIWSFGSILMAIFIYLIITMIRSGKI